MESRTEDLVQGPKFGQTEDGQPTAPYCGDDQIMVTVPVTKGRIADLLCCAFEGGSNYWYNIVRFRKPRNLRSYIDPEHGRIYRHIDYPLSPGGHLVIDATETDEPQYQGKILDLDTIKKGLEIMREKHPRHFADWMSEDDDGTTGDVFLQCCLFGEVVFG